MIYMGGDKGHAFSSQQKVSVYLESTLNVSQTYLDRVHGIK